MKKVKLKTIEKTLNVVTITLVSFILLTMWTGYYEPSKLLVSFLGLSFIFKVLAQLIPETKENK